MNSEALTATILSTLGEALWFGYVARETVDMIDFSEPKSSADSASDMESFGTGHVLDGERQAEITL